MIEKVLISFRPITNEFLGKQSERKKQEKELLEIPLKEDWFQDYVSLENLDNTLFSGIKISKKNIKKLLLFIKIIGS